MQFQLLSALVVAGATLSGLASPVAVPRGLDASNGTVNLSKRFSNTRWSFFDVGLGACGETNVASDFIVALNADQYGSGYPGPHCGKTITLSYGGKTAQAKIMDRCSGCPYGGLDLSRGLFQHFASEDVGIVYGRRYDDHSCGYYHPRATTTRATTTQAPVAATTAATREPDAAAAETTSSTRSTTHQSQPSSSSTRLASQRLNRVSSPSSTTASLVEASAVTSSASVSSTPTITSSAPAATSTVSEQERYDQNVKLLSQAIQQVGNVFEKLFGASESAPATPTA